MIIKKRAADIPMEILAKMVVTFLVSVACTYSVPTAKKFEFKRKAFLS